MKIIGWLYLGLVLSGTAVCIGQTISTKDSIQDLQISENKTSTEINAREIAELRSSFYEMRSSVDTSRSWVIGFGCALSGLHLIQLVTARNRKNGNGNTP